MSRFTTIVLGLVIAFVCVFAFVAATRIDDTMLYLMIGVLLGAVVWAPFGYVAATQMVDKAAQIRAEQLPSPARQPRQVVQEPIYDIQAPTRPAVPALTAPQRKFFMIGDAGESAEVDGGMGIQLQ